MRLGVRQVKQRPHFVVFVCFLIDVTVGVGLCTGNRSAQAPKQVDWPSDVHIHFPNVAKPVSVDAVLQWLLRRRSKSLSLGE